MARDHEILIDALCRSANPIRRARPPTMRAFCWLPILLAVGWLAVDTMRQRFALPTAGPAGFTLLAPIAALAAGIFSLIAAFNMSVPGQRVHGMGLVVLGFVGWVAFSIAGVAVAHWPIGSFDDGRYCFEFILVASAPMSALMVFALRYTPPLKPKGALFVAGAGIAALSVSMLSLCHPFKIDVMDLAMHFLAAATSIALTVLFGVHGLTGSRDRVRPVS